MVRLSPEISFCSSGGENIATHSGLTMLKKPSMKAFNCSLICWCMRKCAWKSNKGQYIEIITNGQRGTENTFSTPRGQFVNANGHNIRHNHMTCSTGQKSSPEAGCKCKSYYVPYSPKPYEYAYTQMHTYRVTEQFQKQGYKAMSV